MKINKKKIKNTQIKRLTNNRHVYAFRRTKGYQSFEFCMLPMNAIGRKRAILISFRIG